MGENIKITAVNYLFLASLQFPLAEMKAFNNHIALQEGDWPLVLDLTQTDGGGVEANGKEKIWLSTSGPNQRKAGKEQFVRMSPRRMRGFL